MLFTVSQIRDLEKIAIEKYSISCDELGLPKSELLQQKPVAMIADFDELRAENLPARRMSSHKGDFGHVLVVGGDYGMPGAARMAAEAAARVGAGVISVVTRPEHILAVNIGRPELMVHGINDIKNSENFAKLLDKADVIVVGPGLGRSKWSEEIMELVLKTEKPLVVDADALNYIAENQSYQNNWIITPHPGEAARLLNCTTQDIQNDRFKSVQILQKKYGGVCVLKGAASLIWDGEAEAPTICNAGNPGMASGGMGDVLSGVIAGLLAQKLSLNNAAILGVLLHAHAGDKAAKESGERGLLASDLFPYLRKLVNDN